MLLEVQYIPAQERRFFENSLMLLTPESQQGDQDCMLRYYKALIRNYFHNFAVANLVDKCGIEASGLVV